MSAFDQLSAQTQRPQSSTAYRSLAIQVTQYDLTQQPHSVVGYPMLDNGQPDTSHLVRVFMKPDDKAQEREYQRREFKDLTNTSSKSYTDIGGILLFNYVFETDTPNVYAAHWIDVASHTPGQAAIRAAYATVNFKNTQDNGKPYFYVNYYKTNEAIKVSSLDELKGQLEKTLQPLVPDMHMMAAIRIVNPAGQSVAVTAQTQWKKDHESSWQHALTGAESAQAFIQGDKWPLIQQVFQEGEVTMCEIIPGARIHAATATRNNLLKNKTRLEKLIQIYRNNDEPVYLKTYVVARQHEGGDGKPFLTHIQGVDSAESGVPLKDIPTVHFNQPATAVSEEIPDAPHDTATPAHTQEAQQAAQAPQAPQAPTATAAQAHQAPANAVENQVTPASSHEVASPVTQASPPTTATPSAVPAEQAPPLPASVTNHAADEEVLKLDKTDMDALTNSAPCM